MTYRYRPINASEVPSYVRDGRWDTPRHLQGQIVTVSYSAGRERSEAGPGAKYRRTHDASLAGGASGRQHRYEILVEDDA